MGYEGQAGCGNIHFFLLYFVSEHEDCCFFLRLQSLVGQVFGWISLQLGAHESARFLLLRNDRLTKAPSFYDETVLYIGTAVDE